MINAMILLIVSDNSLASYLFIYLIIVISPNSFSIYSVEYIALLSIKLKSKVSGLVDLVTVIVPINISVSSPFVILPVIAAPDT